MTQEQIPINADRRAFLENTIYSLLSIMAGAAGVASAMYLFSPPKNRDRVTWTDVGEIPDLISDVPKQITFERNRVDGWQTISRKETAWVVERADQSLTVFAPSCTHLGCAYHWESKRDMFVCPCHGSAFSRTGQVVTGPAVRPLERYEVKRVGSRLWLGPLQHIQEHKA